jgi:hypothetical protein
MRAILSTRATAISMRGYSATFFVLGDFDDRLIFCIMCTPLLSDLDFVFVGHFAVI